MHYHQAVNKTDIHQCRFDKNVLESFFLISFCTKVYVGHLSSMGQKVMNLKLEECLDKLTQT